MDHNKKEECCPAFNPDPWQGKEHHWQDKLFIMETMPQFFHIPFPSKIGKMMDRQWKKIEDANAEPEMADFLWLSYDPSPWKAEHYIAVTKEVPNAENVKISGNFISKVFDGPYNAAPKWIKEMDNYLEEKGKKSKKYYFYYTTCPKCAKKHGHNYVVLFAQI
ncbi:hypothetical protein KKB10_01130 [Patescibacteria group bacterium]|nr:hypothetical protein [Patescibacteria group bacterium]MBU1951815.1 hypothetical protein [Patescibacteria group bacterium]